MCRSLTSTEKKNEDRAVCKYCKAYYVICIGAIQLKQWQLDIFRVYHLGVCIILPNLQYYVVSPSLPPTWIKKVDCNIDRQLKMRKINKPVMMVAMNISH